jgi:hypothetical protein
MPKKLPHIQLYPGDWMRDPVSACSIAAQGLWLRMMFLAHDSERYGYLVVNGLPMPDEFVARRCGSTLSEYQTLLAELFSIGVPSRTPDGIIFSRRMVRDAKRRKLSQTFGRQGGNSKLGVEYNLPGYVYLAQRRDGLIKIGISKNPTKRVSKIRKAERDDTIRLLEQLAVADMGTVEATLHKMFDAFKGEGEWFRLSAEQINELCDHVRLKGQAIATLKANPDNDNDIGNFSSERGMQGGKIHPTTIPPPVEAVVARGVEIELPAEDCRAFFDYFTSNGWRVGGKTPMRNWHSALNTWKRNAPNFQKPNGKPRTINTAAPARAFAVERANTEKLNEIAAREASARMGLNGAKP